MLFLLALAGLAASPQQPEKVSIRSGDVQIIAEFTDAGPATPGVLLFPMCAPQFMNGWRPLAAALKPLGISSLEVTYQGWGGSTGRTPPPRTTLEDAQRFWTAVSGPDAEAALAYLQGRLGKKRPVVAVGTSCGVHMALLLAMHHPDEIIGVVGMAGPHALEQLNFVAGSDRVAILGASSADDPGISFARELRAASRHPASDLLVVSGQVHGTPLLTSDGGIVQRMAVWIRDRLREAK